ncbi:WYL domain-containing protein [Glycomyces luteolus]|uniref:WYL domain-containing protein n=1 Tax=Glycomyces luteolus TaxID=2670330 RepID=A0A9X3PCN3_9ACTN|nr:WYL domain-containing protein [Glycomyces luteolus]MDA1362647.1 WYL domain-containing protein [Glycomyces luteolus]
MTPDKFFSLVLALQTRPETTVAAIAAETGSSERTVQRDLRWLQDAGFPVVLRRGRYGGVFMLPGRTLDVTRLTPGERDQLALNGLDDEQRRRLGVAEEGGRARRKVAARAEGDLLAVNDLVVSDNRPWFGREPTGTSPAALIGDLRTGARLKILYAREGGEPRWRTVDPYGLLAKGGRWYLIADELGKARMWNLARVERWEALRTPRRLRPGAGLAATARELTERWDAGGGLEVRFVLRDRQRGRAERIFGSRLALGEAAEPGWTHAVLRCHVLEEVCQLLSFGDSATVLDPPEAREKVKELAASILAHYGD